MAYIEGKLIKIGSYIVPLDLINVDSYNCTPDQRQDVDSYRDLNQDLHRNVADNYKTVVKFQTRPHLEEAKIRALINGIKSNYENAKERKVKLEYFDPDKGDYAGTDGTRYFYWVQPQFKIMQINGNKIFYSSMDFEFIEY